MRNRNLRPAIPAIQLYDDNGNQLLDGGIFHTWDTTSFITSNFQYITDSNKIVCNKNSTGYYKITFECSFYTLSASNIQILSRLYKNGSLVSGGYGLTTVEGDGGQGMEIATSLTITFIIQLKRGDYIQIHSLPTGNDAYTYQSSSRLIIEFIPMRGWDNEKGGLESMRGGIER